MSEAAEVVGQAVGVPAAAVEVCLRGLDLRVIHGPEDQVQDYGGAWVSDERPLEAGEVRVDSEDLVIVVSASVVEVAEKAVHWDGPGTPVPTRLDVQRFDPSTWPDAEERTEAFTTLLAETKTSRRRRYEFCRGCGEWVAPEHYWEDSLCQGCATRLLGVVY